MKQKFTAVIYKLGINPCVNVPYRVSRALNKRGFIPIKGTLNGKDFLANLVPVGNNHHRLFINGDMRNRARVDVDDRITLIIKIDNRPRIEPIPKDLALFLRRNKAARKTWGQLSPSRRKEILRYLNFAKRPETLQRNIKKAISILTNKPSKKRTLAGIRIRVTSKRVSLASHIN